VADILLVVQNLCVEYKLAGKRMKALDHVSFNVKKGEVLGVAGESGCGKSTLGLSIIRLLPKAAEIKKGKILLEGRDLLKLPEDQMNRDVRGRRISIIFQNPQTALNPVFKIETQMIDVLRLQSVHRKRKKPTKSELRQRATEQLRETGIADPAERLTNYPFEFSGGMKQRTMIAMALSSETSLLIADEPTTALDVTIETQILDLLRNMASRYQTSVLYVSHDLGVLSEISTEILIMYAGRIFEKGPTRRVLDRPRHPYTAALLEALPGKRAKGRRLLSIPGQVPSLDQMPEGCTFHPRCPFSSDVCQQTAPSPVEVSPGHWSACLIDQSKGRQKWQWI
jgi:oligopeptide/dipeptide ABC transporter ATP-binding protein